MASCACTSAARPAAGPLAAVRLGRLQAQRAAAGVQPIFGRQARLAAAAPAWHRQQRRGLLQVVAVRVENEEVALGTNAPDFEVRTALARSVPLKTPAACPPPSLAAPCPGGATSPPATLLATLLRAASGAADGQHSQVVVARSRRPRHPCYVHLASWRMERPPAAGRSLAIRVRSLTRPRPPPSPPGRSNHCPFVVHLKPAITELAKEYQQRGVKVVAISSNSVETHPQVGGLLAIPFVLAVLPAAARWGHAPRWAGCCSRTATSLLICGAAAGSSRWLLPHAGGLPLLSCARAMLAHILLRRRRPKWTHRTVPTRWLRMPRPRATHSHTCLTKPRCLALLLPPAVGCPNRAAAFPAAATLPPPPLGDAHAPSPPLRSLSRMPLPRWLLSLCAPPCRTWPRPTRRPARPSFMCLTATCASPVSRLHACKHQCNAPLLLARGPAEQGRRQAAVYGWHIQQGCPAPTPPPSSLARVHVC